MSTLRRPSGQYPNILDLNADVLDAIFDLVSVQEACRFRLCSQRAAQVVARRALSIKRITAATQNWFAFMGKRREKLALVRKLTLVYPMEHEPVFDSLSNDFTIFMQALSGVKELIWITPGHVPQASQYIPKSSLLETLELPDSNSEISAWILHQPHNCLSHLTRLSLSEFNFSDSVVASIPPLLTLRSLVVKSLSGNLEHLVQFAPHLERLDLVSVYDATRGGFLACITSASDVPAAPSHAWQSLLSVRGPLRDIHRILPLFQRVHQLVLTQHFLQTTEEHFITDTLRHKQPCCIELDDDRDLPPFACYHPLSFIAQRLYYLRIRVPNKDKRCLDELQGVAKELTSLLCLEIDLQIRPFVDDALPVHRIHYLTCKIPSLRFLLIPRDKQVTHSGGEDRTQHPALIKWNAPDMNGFRLSRGPMGPEAWVRGRVVASLLSKTAKRVRAAYCGATFETRLNVEELLFPGPVPDIPNGGGILTQRPHFPVCYAEGDGYRA